MMDDKRKKIGVLMGGFSPEREVSLDTGKAIYDALRVRGYQAIAIDIQSEADLLELGRSFADAQDDRIGIDVAFLGLHGRYGEDGTIQGLLELMQIPYTGSGVMASAICMDKWKFKEFMKDKGVRMPGSVLAGENLENESSFEYPVVVKPARQGSTIGITIVRGPEDLKKGIEEAGEYDQRVLIEDYIKGKEVTVGILEGEPLTPLEIIPPGDSFYDYHAKYTEGVTEYLVPAKLPEDLLRELQEISVKCYDLLGCRGYARVDFLVDEEAPFLLEVNTLPGMTKTSLLPKAASHNGISFEELVERILKTATLDY